MAFSEFTLELVAKSLGIHTEEADLFPDLSPVELPEWLPILLARGTRLAYLSEKSRSEFIVVPTLLAARELCGERMAIYSGQRFDVDVARGLSGECDFILALGPAIPPLRAPIATVVEAGLGQCIAQMVAARMFNESGGQNVSVYGCVTNGEAWQFLRLKESAAVLDIRRYYMDNVGGVLAVLLAIIAEAERSTSR